MGVPITELFPGFSRPPNDERAYVKERKGWSSGGTGAPIDDDQYTDDEFCDAEASGREISRRAGITIAPDLESIESAEGFRTCPYCDGDGVSGWDEKERDILCQYCEGGVIR